jgi:hypothetical protein
MAGYEVVPEALRAAATAFTDGEEQWAIADDAVNGATLQPGDLGWLGQISGFIAVYNDVVASASTVLRQGQNELGDAGTKLGVVAAVYENQEAEYYAEFGYLAESRLSLGKGEG